ncbi:MAG: glycosyltransferase family 2 protein [Candidatus Omnitrophota bacterium]|nr:glycosyltransferase family 2 protein [Candidatus Omnitrophota bacterium]MDZ4241950.1 glycosyltransferase family 2 protein [Candidatus Omnitrophota bacterium]
MPPERTVDPARVDISVIIPVFNEEPNIPELFKRLAGALKPTGCSFEIIFVDDGSTDRSFEILSGLCRDNPGQLRIIRFSRNFGHQIAITAGFKYARGRAAVVTDADLQDPPEVIRDFIAKWKEGYELVYGVRTEREGETFFKKFTAGLFYRLIRKMTSIDIPANAGDFYLMDRKVLNAFNSLNERHRFNRGLLAWLGFKRAAVEYERKARFSGTTKYPFWKMVKFAMDAVVSFSFSPLRFVFGLGVFFSLFAFAMILFIIYLKLFTQTTIQGWSSLMAMILLIGGIQLLAVGLIGEYLARIGDDTKSRPLYVVSEVLE